MVRVSTLKKNIHSNLSSNLRRVYPILKGPIIWGDLREKREEFHDLNGRFPLVNEPLIEAIPQYEPGVNSEPENLSKSKSVTDDFAKKRLDRLAEYLDIAGDDWPLYPHQKESLEGYLAGKDVVIATGTGSGKTEAFLFPMFSHLDTEAIRCEEDEEESQRALKAIILYPMNALVADQMKRIRKYLGNPEIAAKYMNNGYGRFPQFGMYTGRTDYHGWYEISDNTSPSKTQRRMRDLIGNYRDLQQRDDAWNSLQELGKVPAIGGEVKLASDGYLTYDQLSTKAKKDARQIIDPATGKKLNKKAMEKRYILDPKEQTFERFNNQDLKPQPSSSTPGAHVKWMGDKLDRELVVRHQMHHGGLRQHIRDKEFPEEYTEDIVNSTGTPDVLVTNYSMLEYMLMRPLEHIFWHNTGEWLRNCKRKDHPILRRKLLLVVDEAHLYQGAMGTEFSLLLNRILSVLGDDIQRDQIQFIITSASLGEKEENKVNYAKDLLSLNEHRANNLVIPESKIISIEGDDVQKFFTKDELGYFVNAWDQINSGVNRQHAELELLISLFGNDAKEKYEQYQNEGFSDQEAYETTCFSVIYQEWWAIRLMRLLLQPNELCKQDKDLITTYYQHDELLRNELDKPLDRIPRRFSLIQQFMFQRESEDTSQATEVLLDLIASARLHKKKDGKIKPEKPLLPVRAHLFVRGNTVNRICCQCGTIYENGDFTCTVEECDARTYTLYFDRNCGGVYLQLWLEGDVNNFRFTWQKGQPYLNPRDFGEAKRAHQAREIVFSGRQSSDRLLGVLARVLDEEDDSVTHWLDPYSGFLSETKNEGMIPIRICRFRDGEFNFNNPETSSIWNARKWEAKNGFVEPRKCFYCDGDYSGNSRSSQFSDTETRGDEYFCGIITEAISIQDTDPESKTPHKGKKMLVFSDGRQRAARLAAKLSDSIAVDEGRALFTYLHRRDWFNKLDEEKRNLDRIYPYMCLLSASFGLNYLSDSENNPDKTRMMMHSSSLSAWILLNIDSKQSEYVQLKSDLMGNLDDDEISSKQMLAQMKSAFKKEITANQPHEDDDDAEKDKKANNLVKLKEYNSTNIEREDVCGFDVYQDWKNNTEIKKIMNKQKARLRKLAASKQLCLCLGTRNIFLEDTKFGHIEISKIITRCIISDMEEGELHPTLLDGFVESWLTKILPMEIGKNLDRVPTQFGSLIIKWIVDKNFGLQEIGLGTFKLIVDQANKDKLGPKKTSLLESMVPQILRSYQPIKRIEGSGRNRRVYSSEGRIISNKKTGAFTNDSHWDAFDYTTPKSPLVDDEGDLPDEIIEWIDDVFGIDDTDIIDIITHDWKKYFKIDDPKATLGDRRPWNLKAEKLVFIPWEGLLEKDFVSCEKCHVPKYNLNLKCLNCGNSGSRDLSDTECKNYFDERLKHWRNRVLQLEEFDYKKDNSSVLQIYRAEEHTAQIGKKTDKDSLFSGTELHELMFQDIPLKGRNLGIDTRIEQPPIDILSCTTTMEVGIDIGNLTAVALRTVPPHSANYQQRVGRAGRGKSEVSLALTWVDNSAYAQAHFSVPERLVKHPEEAPNLYLNNLKIKKRHFNAVCFQRYFKRKQYLVDTLTFEGMDPSMGQSNLLQSLGSSEGFFTASNPSYSSISMIEWLGKIDPDIKDKIIQSTRTSDSEFNTWKEELIQWLKDETSHFKGGI